MPDILVANLTSLLNILRFFPLFFIPAKTMPHFYIPIKDMIFILKSKSYMLELLGELVV